MQIIIYSEFSYFCLLALIHKLNSIYNYFQSNQIPGSVNQSLKSGLKKVLSESKFSSWNLYLNFVVFSYNLSVHSSTGLTPFYLTFGSEARLPPDLIFGSTSRNFNIGNAPSRGALSSLLYCFSVLLSSFNSVRENLHSFHQRERNHYDLGAFERVFKSGDILRVCLKSKRQWPSKLLSDWSGPHEVLSVKGAVIEVKELSSKRKYQIHHDRLSNPLFSNSNFQSLPRELSETQSFVPLETPVEPDEDLAPVGNPE